MLPREIIGLLLINFGASSYTNLLLTYSLVQFVASYSSIGCIGLPLTAYSIVVMHAMHYFVIL